MTQIPETKKKELLELVEKQKKAKLNWVAVITQLSEEEIITTAWEIGLVIDKDQIMLPSETEEGKKEKRIQKNIKIIIEHALNERVLRNYMNGAGKIFRENLEKSGYSGTGGIGEIALSLAFAGIATAFAGVKQATKSEAIMEFGKVEISLCKLDGSIDCLVTKKDERIHVKYHLLQDMKTQSGQNFHYFVPIKQYYELVLIPRNEDKLVNKNQKKNILSLCENLDNKISDFCGKIVEQSVTVIEKKPRKVNYSVLLTSGVRAENTEKFIQLNKYSLYLSYRTHLNQLYYELIQKKQLPNLVDFVLNNLPNQYQLFEKHIQSVFHEFVKRFDSWGFKENVKIIQSIHQSL